MILGSELKKLNKKRKMYLTADYAAFPDMYVSKNKQAMYHYTKNDVYNRKIISSKVLVANICIVFHLTSTWLAVLTTFP
jgi:hypothetical protein